MSCLTFIYIKQANINFSLLNWSLYKLSWRPIIAMSFTMSVWLWLWTCDGLMDAVSANRTVGNGRVKRDTDVTHTQGPQAHLNYRSRTRDLHVLSPWPQSHRCHFVVHNSLHILKLNYNPWTKLLTKGFFTEILHYKNKITNIL